MINFKVEIFSIRLPLSEPYKLSFTTIEEFNTVFCRIANDKRFGIGAVTALQGYSPESFKEIKKFQKKVCKNIIQETRGDINEIVPALNPHLKTSPFAVSPLFTAIETLNNSDFLSKKINIPLVKLLPLFPKNKLMNTLHKGLRQNYSRFKIKVGKNHQKDLTAVNNLLSELPPGSKIRIDANQAYTFKEAEKFIAGVSSPEKIELFEQPLSRESWQQMANLNRQDKIPLMLDEAIYTVQDIEKARQLECADFVKLKLAKFGSVEETIAAVNFARKAGLDVILGNGAQSEIGCLLEAQIYAHCGLSPYPGEMNGFLKQKTRLLPNVLRKNDQLIYEPNLEFESLLNKFSERANKLFSSEVKIKEDIEEVF